MTSIRRKTIKWRKWERKNPEKADALVARKAYKLLSWLTNREVKQMFTKKLNTQIEDWLFKFPLKSTVVSVSFAQQGSKEEK